MSVRVVITIIGKQGTGKSVLAGRLMTFLKWLGVTNVKISERLP